MNKRKIFRVILSTLIFVFALQITAFAGERSKNTPSNAEKYAEEYQAAIDEVTDAGISMSDANTKEELKKLFEGIAPSHGDDIAFYVEITDREDYGPGKFEPAVAGTRNNPNGKTGSGGVRVYIKSSEDESQAVADALFSIRPKKYVKSSSSGGGGGSSSGGGGGGGGSSRSSGASASASSQALGLNTKADSIIDFTWEKNGDNWKCLLPDGTYANSSWVLSAEKWYLIGKNENMLTGWQLANGKWYYFSQSGEMLTGWQHVNGKWYYMEPSGAMLSDTVTPDGYTVNKNGEWIQ